MSRESDYEQYKNHTTLPGECVMFGDEHLAEAIEWLDSAEALYKEAEVPIGQEIMFRIQFAQVEALISIAELLLAEQTRKEKTA